MKFLMRIFSPLMVIILLAGCSESVTSGSNTTEPQSSLIISSEKNTVDTGTTETSPEATTITESITTE